MSLYDKLRQGKPLTVHEAHRLLQEMGFVLRHSRGSHQLWIRKGEIFTLPVHGKDLKRWITRELRKIYYGKKERHT